MRSVTCLLFLKGARQEITCSVCNCIEWEWFLQLDLGKEEVLCCFILSKCIRYQARLSMCGDGEKCENEKGSLQSKALAMSFTGLLSSMMCRSSGRRCCLLQCVLLTKFSASFSFITNLTMCKWQNLITPLPYKTIATAVLMLPIDALLARWSAISHLGD